MVWMFQGIPLADLARDIFTPGSRPQLMLPEHERPELYKVLTVTSEAADMWVRRNSSTFTHNLSQMEARGKSVATKTAIAQARVKDQSVLMNACTLYTAFGPDWKLKLLAHELKDLNTRWWAGSPFCAIARVERT